MSKLSWISGGIATLACVGIVDAAYVALHSSQSFLLPCGFAGGCDQVLSSPYAKFVGVPVAWLGLAFYATVAGCALFAWFGFEQVLRISFFLAALAFAFTLYLFYLQAAVIRAFCDYCLLSALLVTSIFGLHVWARRSQSTAAEGHSYT
jgi:uncharacterized membrane protein